MTPNVAPCRSPALGGQCADGRRCYVDGEPCCVLAELVRSVTTDALEEVLRALPCEQCRLAMAQAHDLSQVRLGRCQRRVLLEAADAGEDGWTPFAAVRSRSQREAHLRTIRKLHKMGLASPRNQQLSGKVAGGYCDGRPYRAARLIPFHSK